MQSKPQGEPNRHHFIPEFLLRQWCSPDGRLVRYWRSGRGSIISKPASPRAVCFERGLYRTVGFPQEHEQQMELLFFSPIDDAAARVHKRLVDDGASALTDAERTEWGRFIMSLWFRAPLDVRNLWEAVAGLAGAATEKSLQEDDSPVELPPAALRQLQMEAMRSAIDNRQRGETLINMDWAVLERPNTRELWISDWPMDLPSSAPWLGTHSSYVTVPITPSKLFVAAGSRLLMEGVARLPPRDLIRRQNRATVSHAENFVGATNNAGKDFITRNFGQLPRPSITQSIAERYQS